MATPIIKTATASDEPATIAAILLAFSADPAARWTWRDPQVYLTHFPPFIRAFGGKAFAHGAAYYVDGYAGAALWLPPDVHPDEDALISLLQQTVSKQRLNDVFAAFEQMGSYHPTERIGSAAHRGRPFPTGEWIWLGPDETRARPVRSRQEARLSGIHKPAEHPPL